MAFRRRRRSFRGRSRRRVVRSRTRGRRQRIGYRF